MLSIGLIKEGKVPSDNRVALTPSQCKWLLKNVPDLTIKVGHSDSRCFSDTEFASAGIGVKEVPVEMLISGKTYLFFSHTKKKQPNNQKMMHAMMDKNITLVDYECLEHEDGQRIIGFGFFAGVVGAHNGMMAYGNRTKQFSLGRVYKHKDYRELIHTYFGLKLPNIKVAVTGSGRVAHGILEIMNLLGVTEVEKEDFVAREFDYPVYVHLKGSDLYKRKDGKPYNREKFHQSPQDFFCTFGEYASQTDVLMNGVYWDKT